MKHLTFQEDTVLWLKFLTDPVWSLPTAAACQQLQCPPNHAVSMCSGESKVACMCMSRRHGSTSGLASLSWLLWLSQLSPVWRSYAGAPTKIMRSGCEPMDTLSGMWEKKKGRSSMNYLTGPSMQPAWPTCL